MKRLLAVLAVLAMSTPIAAAEAQSPAGSGAEIVVNTTKHLSAPGPGGPVDQQQADLGQIEGPLFNAFSGSDYATAAMLAPKLADEGFVDAETILAQMYSRGLGLPRNAVRALTWCEIAWDRDATETLDDRNSRQGDRLLCDHLAADVTPAQAASIRAFARIWWKADDKGQRSAAMFFDFRKSAITPTAAQILSIQADIAHFSGGARFTVIGDADGSERTPQALSLARAQAVRAYLMKHGVAAGQISVRVTSDTQSWSQPTSRPGSPLNGRADIYYTETGGLGAGRSAQ